MGRAWYDIKCFLALKLSQRGILRLLALSTEPHKIQRQTSGAVGYPAVIRLTPELVGQILAKLDVYTLANINLVSRDFHDLSNESPGWQRGRNMRVVENAAFEGLLKNTKHRALLHNHLVKAKVSVNSKGELVSFRSAASLVGNGHLADFDTIMPPGFNVMHQVQPLYSHAKGSIVYDDMYIFEDELLSLELPGPYEIDTRDERTNFKNLKEIGWDYEPERLCDFLRSVDVTYEKVMVLTTF